MDESLHEHHERNSLSSVSGAVRGERVEVRVAEKPLLVVEDAPKTPLFWEPTVENLSPSHPSSLDSFPSHSSSHLSSLHSSSLASRTHFTPPEEHPSLPEYHAEKHAASSLSLETRASNAFYAANGAVYWTLAQLADALLTMDEATFTHHVNDARNDFASWVTGCFTGNEQAFAERLRVRSRKSMIQEFLALTPKRESTRLSPSSQSVQHQSPSSPLPSAYHDEKQPVAVSWRPAQLEERNALVRTVLEQLTQARFLAATDIGRAREQFIAARTRVFSELSESERVAVLPKLRDTYEYLRHLR
jgi:ribose 1,5-bisphosphokinase PhnN